MSNEHNEKQTERTDFDANTQEEKREEVAVETNLNSLGDELAELDNTNQFGKEEKL